MIDLFTRRKKAILSKLDRSSKGKWDKKISKLCEKINSLENYYTTSSCSGRIIIMIDQEKKGEGLFIKIHHDAITLRQLKSELDNVTAHSCSQINRTQLIQKNEEIMSSKNVHLITSRKSRASDNERGNLIKFKQEPCIIHIACKNFEDAKRMLDYAQLSGWKRAGIIASGNRFVVEMSGTEKLEFPIIDKGRILVNDDFLRLIIKKTNDNLKKSWERIEKLKGLI
ncbi:MAG: tRNA wybutosine-synthesizing 3 family protein [Nanoarchaeota archaeon]